MHNVGTVPTFKMQNVRTVPTYKMNDICCHMQGRWSLRFPQFLACFSLWPPLTPLTTMSETWSYYKWQSKMAQKYPIHLWQSPAKALDVKKITELEIITPRTIWCLYQRSQIHTWVSGSCVALRPYNQTIQPNRINPENCIQNDTSKRLHILQWSLWKVFNNLIKRATYNAMSQICKEKFWIWL